MCVQVPSVYSHYQSYHHLMYVSGDAAASTAVTKIVAV